MDEVGYLQSRPGRTGVDELGVPMLYQGTKDEMRACCPSSTIAWRYAQATGLIQERRCIHNVAGTRSGWCEGLFLRKATEELGWSDEINGGWAPGGGRVTHGSRLGVLGEIQTYVVHLFRKVGLPRGRVSVFPKTYVLFFSFVGCYLHFPFQNLPTTC